MKASNIKLHEQNFFRNKVDSQGKKFTLNEKVIVFGESEKLPVVSCQTQDNDNTFYYQAKHPKNQIVIHYTAGYIKGDLAMLTRTNKHISVPYLLPRFGKILNLWDPVYWSYHLGPTAIGGNTLRSKGTIGIEISNIGYLKPIGNNLVTGYGDSDIYCNLNQEEFYTKISPNFRGFEYFASFTDTQYENLILLLRYLTERFNIPREFLPIGNRIQSGDSSITSFNGIISHINYRKSGKWDIGPAFDWDRVIRGVEM